MSRERFVQLVTELTAHPGLGPLATEVAARCERAHEKRDYAFPRPGSATLGQPERIAAELALVGELDLRQILEVGAQSSDELDLLNALFLLAVAAHWPTDAAAQLRLGQRMLWLETHSGLRCLSAAGAVLDGGRLKALADALLRGLDGQKVAGAENAVGRAWLLSCGAPECADIAERVRYLESSVRSGEGACRSLEGVLGPKPRHPVVTVLLALSTLLFIDRAFRAAGRLALSSRCPAVVTLTERGLELASRHELLGRVLKERKHIVPIGEISQVLREVRYPRLGLYAGLGALTLGTLLGTRWFVDGLRVAGLSFTMMAWGVALVLLGLALDLLLSLRASEAKGKCRLVVHTRKGGGFTIAALEPRDVDAMLAEVSARLAAR